MVSLSTSKKENATDFAEIELNITRSRLVPGHKPLQRLKFYLDIKNSSTASKIETKIKELGGNIELFLIKEVTHVVTDSETWYFNRKIEKVTNEHHTNVATKTLVAKNRPKTRADAMLERARCQPTVITKNPLEQAKQWGIAIWTIEKTIAWLDKVVLSIKTSQLKKKLKQKVSELKGPYIKFEAFDRKTRPVFKEISDWPVFNLSGTAGDPAFVCRSHVERNMTRKTRSNHLCINPGIQPGYCEICRIEYPNLEEHLESEKHLNFIKDNSNFVGLDGLINEKTSVESFLKINGVNTYEKCDSFEADCYPKVILNKMPRTRTSSACDKYKSSPLSPAGSDSGHRLRSKVHINYFANTAEDDDFEIKPEGARQTRELRSSARHKNHQNENGQETWSSGRPKRSTCSLKPKRFSADERLVADNKTYYKVEVMSSKLRSSGLTVRDQEIIKQLQKDDDREKEETENDKGFIVKFRKLRASELLRLNNEAENFLFPKREELSSDEDPDADGPNTTVSSGVHDSTLLLSTSENEKPKKFKVEDEGSMDSNCSETSTARKKRRRTHAEAFIMDNEKYYKFETPGSRLRYQGSFLTPVQAKLPKNNGACLTKNIKFEEEEEEDEDKSIEEAEEESESKINLDELQFSFERVPKSEPWYQTFQRQDRGEEYYTCFSDSGYFKPFLLPYEMGSLPPLNPKICISAYSQAKKMLMEPLSTSTSAGCSTPDQCSNSTQQSETDGSDVQDEDSKLSVDSLEENSIEEPAKVENADEESLCKSKRRKEKLLTGKNPRKSPRQHASTLAILSSLINQRKRREKLSSSSSRNSSSKQSLPSIPEESKSDNTRTSRSETDYDAIAKSIDNFLSVSLDSLDDIDITNEQDIDMHCKVSAVEMLNVLEEKESVGQSKNTRKFSGTPGRKPGRKKKKNRTGWPNKNRRVKKDLIIKEEIDDSTMDSFSVNADSEDNLNCDDTTDINSIIKYDETMSINNLNSSVHENSVNNVNKNFTNDIKESNSLSFNSDKSDRVETVGKTSNDCVESKRNSVSVDLDKWENAEKVLQATFTNSDSVKVNTDLSLQPIVRVQKLDNDIALKHGRTRLRSSSSPKSNVKRPRRMPPSPKSPRTLRKPRGRWYRER